LCYICHLWVDFGTFNGHPPVNLWVQLSTPPHGLWWYPFSATGNGFLQRNPNLVMGGSVG
jgi:hypothetical protein